MAKPCRRPAVGRETTSSDGPSAFKKRSSNKQERRGGEAHVRGPDVLAKK